MKNWSRHTGRVSDVEESTRLKQIIQPAKTSNCKLQLDHWFTWADSCRDHCTISLFQRCQKRLQTKPWRCRSRTGQDRTDITCSQEVPEWNKGSTTTHAPRYRLSPPFCDTFRSHQLVLSKNCPSDTYLNHGHKRHNLLHVLLQLRQDVQLTGDYFIIRQLTSTDLNMDELPLEHRAIIKNSCSLVSYSLWAFLEIPENFVIIIGSTYNNFLIPLKHF